MKVLSSEQIREADAYTITHEPIASIDLMERASKACFNWLKEKYSDQNISFHIVCGQGNNGGDGLAISRLLIDAGCEVNVYIVKLKEKGSPDYETNLARLQELANNFNDVIIHDSISDLNVINQGDVLLDAMFGTGIKGEITGMSANAIKLVNDCRCEKIAIDVPSGLFADSNNQITEAIVRANHTLTFECPKLSYLFPDNFPFVGEFHVLPIGLSCEFIGNQVASNFFVEKQDACNMLKDRKKFSHKGTYGHALICTGSKGKMGAGILSARACLKIGTGLVTAQVPLCGLEVMQTAVPEVMVLPDKNEAVLSSFQDIKAFDVIGVGPGIGQDEITASLLKQLLNESTSPMVIDADAINIIGANKDMLNSVPPNSILTPHPKEFERLVGSSEDNFDRHEQQIKFSKEHNVVIVLKGANTAISDTAGNVFFNSSGNNGMATAGSGDVLTGIITGLLAQGYESIEAAKLGVYLHGFAADLAIHNEVEETLIAGNIIECLKEAFRHLRE